MKKIGLITFHASHNCGSILQAFALQKIIKDKLGYNVEIIDYCTPQQDKLYSIYSKEITPKKILRNIWFSFFYKILKKHYDDYEKGIHKYLVLSDKKYTSFSSLNNIDELYDILICGSDQIWNIACEDYDDAYFLAFSNSKKKIAYAPSFGAVNINQYADDVEQYKHYLKDFHALSMREKNGKKWLEQLTNRNVELILDPTVLLTKDDWENYFNIKTTNQKFIFYYAFSYSKEVNQKVKEISDITNLPVLMFDATAWVRRRLYRYNFNLTKSTGPDMFFYLMKNAQLVFTTSFHGTVFSAIFEKTFWFLDSSMHNKDDDRALTMLEQFGITNRMVHVNDILDKDIFEQVDYEKVKEKIKPQQKYSLEYLENAIKELYNEN